MNALSLKQIEAISILLFESDDNAFDWIEWFRPYIASLLDISEKEVEEKYYYTFFN